MQRTYLLAALAAAAVVASCDTVTGLFSGEKVRLAVIERVGNSNLVSPDNAAFAVPADSGIRAPDTVAVGEAFAAEISTWEADGCWSKDRTEVERGSLEAHVRPYNRSHHGPGTECPQAVQEIMHTAEVSFSEPGEAVLKVTGFRVIDGEIDTATTVTREKNIHVRVSAIEGG